MLRARAHTRRLLGLRRSSLLLAVYGACYLGYLLSGALVFAALEAPEEHAIRNKLLDLLADFKHRHTCLSACIDLELAYDSVPRRRMWMALPEAGICEPLVRAVKHLYSNDVYRVKIDNALENLIQEVVKASNRGVSAANNVSGEPNWSFGQSLFFSSTIVTTIGYGNVTPLSREGKMFCMVYAMIGIPLTLVLLSALVERLMVLSTAFLQYLNSRLGHLYQPFNIRVLHLFLIGGILLVFGILLPAAFFAEVEPEWDYLDSLYYCFISLTTVGLGDYIPGDFPNQPYRPLYKIATTVYLLAGLAFMMLLLTIYYEIPELNLGVLFLMRSDERTGDPEKMRLSTPATIKYTEEESKEGSPSPEDITPVHARP